jgi:acyl-CoA thioesterase-1
MRDIIRKIATASACATLLLGGCAPADVPVEETQAAADTPARPAAQDTSGVILFLGTSLTAGYGIGAKYAYPALLQQKLDSAGYPLRVVNAGISGETSAGGLRRIDWSLQRPVKILVLELGANDGLRGLSINAMRDNLTQIIERSRERYPDIEIVIAGMEAPPNLGATYTSQFRATFRDLADKYDAALIPFLLDGVAAVRELNQDDGIHPNATGQKRVAENVWSVLEPVIRRVSQSPETAATE